MSLCFWDKHQFTWCNFWKLIPWIYGWFFVSKKAKANFAWKLWSLCCLHIIILWTEQRFFHRRLKFRFQVQLLLFLISWKRHRFWVRPKNVEHITEKLFEEKITQHKRVRLRCKFATKVWSDVISLKLRQPLLNFQETLVIAAKLLWTTSHCHCYSISTICTKLFSINKYHIFSVP